VGVQVKTTIDLNFGRTPILLFFDKIFQPNFGPNSNNFVLKKVFGKLFPIIFKIFLLFLALIEFIKL
jgi:hypothetical protein